MSREHGSYPDRKGYRSREIEITRASLAYWQLLSYLYCCFIVEPFVEPFTWLQFGRVKLATRSMFSVSRVLYIRCLSSLFGGNLWGRGTKGAVKDYSGSRSVFTNRGNSTRLHRRYTRINIGSRTKRPLSRDACTRQITPYTNFSHLYFSGVYVSRIFPRPKTR